MEQRKQKIPPSCYGVTCESIHAKIRAFAHLDDAEDYAKRTRQIVIGLAECEMAGPHEWLVTWPDGQPIIVSGMYYLLVPRDAVERGDA